MDTDTDIFLSVRSQLWYSALLLWEVSSFRAAWYFPVLSRDGTFSLILLSIKLSWNLTFSLTQKLKVMLNLPWFSLRLDPTQPQFRGERGDLREEIPRIIVRGQAQVFWSHVLPQREDLRSLKPAQHQSELMTVRGLTLPIICSTVTSLLWWREGAVCFGFELEYVFLSDARKTLIIALFKPV